MKRTGYERLALGFELRFGMLFNVLYEHVAELGRHASLCTRLYDS